MPQVGATLGEVGATITILLRLGHAPIVLAVVVSCSGFAAWYAGLSTMRNRLQRRANNAKLACSQQATESLMSFETIKLFGAEGVEAARYHAKQSVYVRSEVRKRWWNGFTNLGGHMIRNTGLGMALVLACDRVVAGEMSVGEFVMVHMYINQIYQPLASLSRQYGELLKNMTDLEKMAKLLATDDRIRDAPDALTSLDRADAALPAAAPLVRFDAVAFRYNDSAGVSGISFAVPRGASVALVGPTGAGPYPTQCMHFPMLSYVFALVSLKNACTVCVTGAGKSTITRLLCRFFEASFGAVRVAGVDVREVTQAALRRFVGVVAQVSMTYYSLLATCYLLLATYVLFTASSASLRRRQSSSTSPFDST